MFKLIERYWTKWSQRRRPVVLLLATLIAAFIAIALLIGAVSGPAILYKEF